MMNDITETLAQPIGTIIDRWQMEISRMDGREPSEWESIDLALDRSQYAYIRLGLLLEKIRNKCYWKYAAGKFGSFREWCERRMDLACWQANNYIRAAEVAIYLANAGFTKIPRNFSQAASLIPAFDAEVGYYQDRPILERIWQQACELPKITANAIKSLINPDAIEKESIRLPKDIQAQAIEQARNKGVSLGEYLKELVQQDAYQEAIDSGEIPEVVTEPDPKMGKVLDRLERGWQKLQLMESSQQLFDRMVNMFVQKYRPQLE